MAHAVEACVAVTSNIAGASEDPVHADQCRHVCLHHAQAASAASSAIMMPMPHRKTPMKQPAATANRSESIFFACNKRLNDMQPAQGQQMDDPQCEARGQSSLVLTTRPSRLNHEPLIIAHCPHACRTCVQPTDRWADLSQKAFWARREPREGAGRRTSPHRSGSSQRHAAHTSR